MREGLLLGVLLLHFCFQTFANETVIPEVAERGRDYKVRIDLNHVPGVDTMSMPELLLVVSKSSSIDNEGELLNSIVAFNDGVLDADLFVANTNDTGAFNVDVYYRENRLFSKSNAVHVIDQGVKRIVSSSIPALFLLNSVNDISVTCSNTSFENIDSLSVFIALNDTTNSSLGAIYPYVKALDVVSNSTLFLQLVVPNWSEPGYYNLCIVENNIDSIMYDSIYIHDFRPSPDFYFEGIGKSAKIEILRNEVVTYGLNGRKTSFLSATDQQLYLVSEDKLDSVSDLKYPLPEENSLLSVNLDIISDNFLVVDFLVPDDIEPGSYHLYYYDDIVGLLKSGKKITVLDDYAVPKIHASPSFINVDTQSSVTLTFKNLLLQNISTETEIYLESEKQSITGSILEVENLNKITVNFSVPDTVPTGFYDINLYSSDSLLYSFEELLIVSEPLKYDYNHFVYEYLDGYSMAEYSIDNAIFSSMGLSEPITTKGYVGESSSSAEWFTYNDQNLNFSIFNVGISGLRQHDLVMVAEFEDSSEYAFNFNVEFEFYEPVTTKLLFDDYKRCCEIVINDSKISLIPISILQNENIKTSIYSMAGVEVFSESLIVNETVALPKNLNGVYLVRYYVGDQVYVEPVLINN